MNAGLEARRRLLKSGLAAMLGAIPAWGCTPRAADRAPLLGFAPVGISSADRLIVPPDYSAQVLYAWGDPAGIPGALPAFRFDGGNSAEAQEVQAGMHHDAVEFFPLADGGGLLAINHEYTDDGLLHSDGMRTWSAEKVRKSQAAHGVSIIEVRLRGAQWEVVRPSRYARRITAATPMHVSGPAATLIGPGARGTLANCGGGRTPWGTYLTGEENFHLYFVNRGSIPPEQRRYGITARGLGYRWHEHDRRFDAAADPMEPSRFGWVVEIDPYDPRSAPVKRTALGRFKHESATVALAADGRVVVYSGDDESFEHIYKFVSERPYDPARREANRDLLDHGRLYAARFDGDGTGRWLSLPMSAAALVHARSAADAAGATKMDRPEWIAVHPRTQEVYVALTSNLQRGAAGRPPADAANPRAPNPFGHILKWRERGGDAGALELRWGIFALGGEEKGFGGPDGLYFDPNGVLWIQTDLSERAAGGRLGNNQMLAADVSSGEIRRFLTGPNGCEITGATMTPDGRTMFVSVQHPGEASSVRSDPGFPDAVSSWPDHRPGGRPRSATVAIRREDGGPIGS